MTTQLEQDLATAFSSHAGDVVDTFVLAEAAARRGRRLRARTYAVRGAAALVVVVAVTAGAVSVSRSGGAPAVTAEATRSPDPDWTAHPPAGGWAVPRLPAADLPPDPSAAGTDPSLLHFTVDGWSADSPYTTWSSIAGIETISFARGDATYRVSLAKTPAPLDALVEYHNRDMSGHLPTPVDNGGGLYTFPAGPMQAFFYLRWQPAPGVWAQVLGEDGPAADAEQVKARVRLDTTLRCAAPIQLSALPVGARLLGCETTLSGRDQPGRLVNATLWVGENTVDRAEITMMRPHVSASASASASASVSASLTVAGHAAVVFTDDRWRPSVEFPDAGGLWIHVAGTGTYRSPAVLAIAEGIRVAGNPLDPSTWAGTLTS